MEFKQSSPSVPLSIEEKFIIEKTLLTHNHDQHRVECKILFQATENVILYAINPSADADKLNTSDPVLVPGIENIGSNETLGCIIYKISRGMLWECYGQGDLHTKTLVLLEMLGQYTDWMQKWSFCLLHWQISYGEFRLILQLYMHNSLATSIALLKNLLWKNMESLSPRLKAMEMLIEEIMETANWIIIFEGDQLRSRLQWHQLYSVFGFELKN